MPEIHHATPGTGRRLLVHLTLVIVAGAVVLWAAQAYQPALLEWVRSDPSQTRTRAQMLIAGAALIVLAPVIGIAIYLWQIAGRTIAGERFPPEGLVIVRDIPVVRGEQARARGRVFKAFACALLIVAIAMTLVFWRLATSTPAASGGSETFPPSQAPGN